MPSHVGLDFGTTNSAIAVARPDRSVALAQFSSRSGTTNTFRSILFFHPESLDPQRRPVPFVGNQAIDAYLQSDGAGRLLQSMKSFLASRLFSSTSILGTVFSLEDLIAGAIRALQAGAEAQFGDLGHTVVVGRPVRFSGAHDADDDAAAVQRLRVALQHGGFDEVVFEYEPVGAAYHYESMLDHDEVILIADFGGGTSDFCLMHVGPGVRRRGRSPRDILGTDGVAVAGDAFDSRIVRHLVVPRLGLGSRYRTIFGQILPFPSWIFSKLERWHHLSLLKSRETMRTLQDLRAQSLEPAKIDALIHLIDYDLGFHLYRSVERTKMELSYAESSRFEFNDPPVRIRETVTRQQFESWIAEEFDDFRACLERLLASTGVAPGDVDRVFMTGGSSFVPAVRRIFAERFGADRIRTGDELTSVARGLALRALDLPD